MHLLQSIVKRDPSHHPKEYGNVYLYTCVLQWHHRQTQNMGFHLHQIITIMVDKENLYQFIPLKLRTSLLRLFLQNDHKYRPCENYIYCFSNYKLNLDINLYIYLVCHGSEMTQGQTGINAKWSNTVLKPRLRICPQAIKKNSIFYHWQLGENIKIKINYVPNI